MKSFLFFTFFISNVVLAQEVYQTPEDFLKETFQNTVPEPRLLWLIGERQKVAEQILGHKSNALRIRYWKLGEKSAWILDEVGKDEPITTGVVINQNKIEQLNVLIFRESRGWEVKYPFFTDQFKEIQLKPDFNLDKTIDGISGATLSVKALQKVARLALYLHQQTALEKP
ncbi:MAG: hypothetical protein RIT27_1986 [Pseudomonadota bacterium]|jgi:hypothetical protein